MSRSDILGGAAVPLTDALPWTPTQCHRMFLVNDSIGTDGRFLLYTLTSQILSEARVLWLACGPITPTQILQGLKKIGCDKSVLTGNSEKLLVRSLALELTDAMEKEDFDEVHFLKSLYRSINEWASKGEGDDGINWVILEDASALANILGERLVYNLLLALNAKSREGEKSFGLAVRCSNDEEKESLPAFSGTSVGQQDWFGAAGSMPQEVATEVPWERSLVEIADGVIDVLPLTSGYTRELQGRIVLTQLPFGRGWKDNRIDSQEQRQHNAHQSSYPAMQIINYGITDHKIVAYIM